MPAQMSLIISRSSLDCTVASVAHYVSCYAKHRLTDTQADKLHYMQVGRESGKRGRRKCFCWKWQQSGEQTSADLSEKGLCDKKSTLLLKIITMKILLSSVHSREGDVISGTASTECVGFVIGCVCEKYCILKFSHHELEVLHNLSMGVWALKKNISVRSVLNELCVLTWSQRHQYELFSCRDLICCHFFFFFTLEHCFWLFSSI